MARKSSTPKRAPSPRPRPGPRQAPPAGRAEAVRADGQAGSAAVAAAEQRLETMHAYVRRDLLRIVVLAALMIGLIVVSPLVF